MPRLVTLVPFLLLAGCNSIPSSKAVDHINIDAEPTATVVVMGKERGLTPLSLPVSTVFPPNYPPELVAHYGRVTLRKNGCTEQVITVSNTVLGRGINAKLDCTGPASATTQSAAPPPAVIAPPPPPAPYSQRLQQLEELRKEGLISEGEYQTIRQRILDAL